MNGTALAGEGLIEVRQRHMKPPQQGAGLLGLPGVVKAVVELTFKPGQQPPDAVFPFYVQPLVRCPHQARRGQAPGGDVGGDGLDIVVDVRPEDRT